MPRLNGMAQCRRRLSTCACPRERVFLVTFETHFPALQSNRILPAAACDCLIPR